MWNDQEFGFIVRVCELDLEGIVAKHRAAAYISENRLGTWYKIRNPRYSQMIGRHELFERERHREPVPGWHTCDLGLITLKCIKNRFGETHPITIRPDFETGKFEITDSPQFTKRTADTERLSQIINETPGLSQNAWWKKSGMMKARFVALVKENNGTLWREEKAGSSLRYFSLVLKTQNNSENNRTGQGNLGHSADFGREQVKIPVSPSIHGREGQGQEGCSPVLSL